MDDRQRQTLRALVDTFVPALERDDDPTGFFATPATAVHADVAIEFHLATLDEATRLGILALLDGLGQFGFPHLPLRMRETMLRVVAGTGPQAAAGVDGLAGLTRLITYTMVDERGRNPLWEGIGYPGPPSPTPPDVAKTLPARIVEEDTTLRADAVVVGSGSGGGVIAAELAAAGLEVVVVEAGGYYNESDFVQLEGWAWQNLYYRSGPVPTVDGNVTMLAGRSLGGGTTINWSNCVVPPPQLRSRWEHEHGLDGLASPSFDAHLAAVLERIGANERCSDYNGPHQRLVEGAELLGWKVRPAMLNLDPEAYDPRMAGHTGYGDQSGAKQGAYKTWLKDAADHGAQMLVRTTVEAILVEDGRATGVRGTTTDEQGRTHQVTVEAPIVVAACGALETPALLARSGIGGPAVGHHLRLHPATAVSGVYEEPQDAWWGPVQAAIMHEFEAIEDGHGFLVEGSHYHPGLAASAFPTGSGVEHKEMMAALPYTASLVFLIQDHGSGRVGLDGDGRAVHAYPFDDPLDARNFHRGVDALVRIHERAGAQQIVAPVKGVEPWRRGDDLEAWLEQLARVPVGAGGLAGMSAHQMGSARMGHDPATSVADPEGQLHDVGGVWVGDTSAFPTSSGVNPMVTCMALARRTAHAILEGR